uniref:BRCT domain-containing protein n=1 Tax=Bombyx mori TaxID=7091 RepID=A0A8R2M0V5_BOMMO|nr:DNA topoisomerase 2-binding protein 1-A [Bombyx mori]
MTDDIKVTFIIPKDCKSQDDCSEDMQLAFVACEQHSGGGLHGQWVHETNWNRFDGLTKRDVFVIAQFEGELFKKLRATKCLLVGPRCLSCCLTEGISIPTGPEPVYTIAMRGLVITASGLSKDKKENIKKKVHWMGGIYNSVLTDDSTHLVSDTVLSDKYIKSVEKGIPVMSETWIEAVWEASQRMNISGSSGEFDIHRLPAFANLQVTTSGISKRDKQMIMKLVNENGGMFSGVFQSETTDVVVLMKDGAGSEKYKAALEYGKACVLPSWVKESAARGVALPVLKYKITAASTSSPLAEHRLPDMSLNFSRITNVRPPSNFVDETRSVDVSTVSAKMKLSQDAISSDTSIDKELQAEFDNLDMSTIKKAGSIFDGFCIWLVGLEGRTRERAAACVSRCGGVRYEAAHGRVTHAVCGARGPAAAAARALPGVPVLSARWLLHSVAQGRALDEAQYLMDPNPKTPAKSTKKQKLEVSSPMSIRNLQLLRRPLDLPPPEPVLQVEEHQDELVNQYLSQADIAPDLSKEKTSETDRPNSTHQQQPDVTEDFGDEPTEEVEQIFAGLRLEVQALNEEAVCELAAELGAAGGALCAGGAGGSHVLLPLEFDPAERLSAAAEPVTAFWIKDCLSQQELVPLQYYHRPVRVKPSPEPPLKGVVASLSTYSGVERAFLDELAKLLGATTQLRFCRRNTANALASTHLICPSPSGDKYAGALKWGLPAVKASWLLTCAAEGRRVSETGHLVGETQAPSTPERIQEEKENKEDTTVMEKENAMLPPRTPAAPTPAPAPAPAASAEQTPAKQDNVDAMSPASRYIAMARQGLLGGDSQDTPKQQPSDAAGDEECRSPASTGGRSRLRELRRGEAAADPLRTPIDPFERNTSTPDSAFGAALRPGSGRLSPDARKRLWRVVNELPSRQPEPPRDKTTPLSEIRNRFLSRYQEGVATPPVATPPATAPRKLQLDEADTPPAKMMKLSQECNAETNSRAAEDAQRPGSLVEEQLQRLQAALSERLSTQRARRMTRDPSPAHPPPPDTEPGPDSQPSTVGWDDSAPAPAAPPPPPSPPPPPGSSCCPPTSIPNREEIMSMIEQLGGEVCDGAEPAPDATHLLCAAPGRSEKMLGSIAAGRWVLHPRYVPCSRDAGAFLPEEEFEWGNPLASRLAGAGGGERVLSRAAHRWRRARACGAAGAFAGLRALLHVPPARRRLLARLVTAGDGHAPDLEPPYSDESINVCFADVKRYPLSARDAQWLVSRRIPVCAPVLLSAYLTDEVPPNPHEHCLPEFRP